MMKLIPYKKYIVGAILAFLIVFSAKLYINSVDEAAHARGYNEANSAWMVKGRQYVDMLDKAHAENVILNEQLKDKGTEEAKKDSQLKEDTTVAQLDLVRDPASSKKTISPKFIDLYNLSLGE